MSPTREAKWYWCLDHERAERAGEACSADRRLGPYDSPEEAVAWQQRVEARNEKWDDDDRRWEGTS